MFKFTHIFAPFIDAKLRLSQSLKAFIYNTGSIKDNLPTVFASTFSWNNSKVSLKTTATKSSNLTSKLTEFTFSTKNPASAAALPIQQLIITLRTLMISLLRSYRITFGDGFLYLRGLFIIFFVDALIADDEPI